MTRIVRRSSAMSLLAGASALALATGAQAQIRATHDNVFADCTADQTSAQTGTNYPGTEIEPSIAVNPLSPFNVIYGVQQDRWSDGGSRGERGGFSLDGGLNFTNSTPLGITLCDGGPYLRASDPWVSFGPSGAAFFSQLVFDGNLPNGGNGQNGQIVSRSLDGGINWDTPFALITDINPQILNDKNSVTADPTDPSYVYVVWDRLQDYTIPQIGVGEGHEGGNTASPAVANGTSGVVSQLASTAAGAAYLALPAGQRRGTLGAEWRIVALHGMSAGSGTIGGYTTPAASDPNPPTPDTMVIGPTYIGRSTDGGTTYEPARILYDPGINMQTIGNIIQVLPDGTVLDLFEQIDDISGAQTISLVRSTDKAATFDATATVISPQHNDVPTTAPFSGQQLRDADILFSPATDPKSGALYVVFEDTRFTGVHGIAFTQSTDGGKTWSTPVQIDQTPANANTALEQAFTPAATVAGGGLLAVTYYDFRNDTGASGVDATDYWAVFCNPSVADCTQRASWGNELRLTQSSFDINNAPNAGGLFLGDYMGLAAYGPYIYPLFGISYAPNQTDLYTQPLFVLSFGQVASLH